MVNILCQKPSALSTYMSQIRDREVQRDSMRFRLNLERIGALFAYEISKTLAYQEHEVETPLGLAHVDRLADGLVLATILRAGLPMHQGMLSVFDSAENAFISAFRKYAKSGKFHVQFEYLAAPEVEGKVVILTDPMLATGSSMVLSHKALRERGEPKHTHLVSAIASREGIEYLLKHLPNDRITIWTGQVDDELTVKGYIVPGLGDAGDLAYGQK